MAIPSVKKQAEQPPSPGYEERLLLELQEPDFWPDRTEQVELVETHISWVFLTRRFAFKLKKPVKFDFLDFSTLAARKEACEDEVRLNRRLASEIYLGVVPIKQAKNGQYSLDGSGDVVDYLVKMHRLSLADRLDVRMEQESLTMSDIEPLIRTLICFYESAPPLTLHPAEHVREIESHVRDNQRVLREFLPDLPEHLLQRTISGQWAVLRLHAELLLNRVRDGRVIEGHGDLRPEHIYLTRPPVAIDCIEFSSDFRRLDVADELCFLAMECDRLHQSDVGEHLLRRCLEGLQDHPATLLLAFYKSYRACVRSKVAALRGRQLSGQARASALQAAREDLQLAADYLAPFVPPMLITVGGLMGSGKSTVASAIAERLGFEHFQTDKVRQEMFGKEDQWNAFGEGKYSTAHREQVYDTLFDLAEERLRQGVSVVLDGTFSTATTRQRAVELARKHQAAHELIWCECPAEIALERVATRRSQGIDESEARPELYAAQSASAEFPGLRESPLELDTTQALPEQLAQIFGHLTDRLSGTTRS